MLISSSIVIAKVLVYHIIVNAKHVISTHFYMVEWNKSIGGNQISHISSEWKHCFLLLFSYNIHTWIQSCNSKQELLETVIVLLMSHLCYFDYFCRCQLIVSLSNNNDVTQLSRPKSLYFSQAELLADMRVVTCVLFRNVLLKGSENI